MAMSQTEGYFEYCFLEQRMIFLNETFIKKRFPVLRQSQHKFYRKTCEKEQSFIFTVYLTNHIFQTYVLLYVIIEWWYNLTDSVNL